MDVCKSTFYVKNFLRLSSKCIHLQNTYVPSSARSRHADM